MDSCVRQWGASLRGFFSCDHTEGYEPWLPFTRSTRTPLHCGGQNPSNPSSPCLLSGDWQSVRCLCCLLWSFCAQNLGGEMGRWYKEWVRGNGARGKGVFLRKQLRTPLDCGPTFGLFPHRDRTLVWNAWIVEGATTQWTLDFNQIFLFSQPDTMTELRINLVFVNNHNIMALWEILYLVRFVWDWAPTMLS